MITQERMEKALRYLAETDEDYATEKAMVERMEILCKRVRSRVFLTSDGTVAERHAKAEVHEDASIADGAYVDALLAYEKRKAKRETEASVLDIWRSLNANRRQGA